MTADRIDDEIERLTRERDELSRRLSVCLGALERVTAERKAARLELARLRARLARARKPERRPR